MVPWVVLPTDISIHGRFLDLFLGNFIRKMSHHLAHGVLAIGALGYSWIHLGSPWTAWAEHGWEVAAPLIWALSLAVCWHSIAAARELISAIRCLGTAPVESDSLVLTERSVPYKIRASGELASLPRFYSPKVWATAITVIGFAVVSSWGAYRFSLGERENGPIGPGMRIVATQVFPLEIGKRMILNTYYENAGDLNRDVEGYTMMALVKTKVDPSERVKDEDDGFRILQEIVKRGGAPPHRIPPHGRGFVTTEGAVLTEEFMRQIKGRERSIFVIGAVIYKEGTLRRETHYCLYNQGDPKVTLQCSKYNEEL